MNLLITICARAGSKGLKNKNIKFFLGQPLVVHTLKAYLLFCEKYGSTFDNIDLALNTDSLELLEQVRKEKLDFVFIERREELAGDVVAKMSVIKDTLEKMEEKQQYQYEYIIDLDLTSPLRTPEDIYETFRQLLIAECADISFSVTTSRRNPYFNMVCEKKDGFYDRIIPAEFVSRQEAPVCYDMNASIYAYRREYLYSGGERKAVIWNMPDTAILDIDSEEDFELLEIIADYLVKKNDKLRDVFSGLGGDKWKRKY